MEKIDKPFITMFNFYQSKYKSALGLKISEIVKKDIKNSQTVFEKCTYLLAYL